MSTFQSRIQEAVRICGSQSELARRITARFNLRPKITPQRIQYLADAEREKPAQGSRLTAQIAAVAGLNAEWLATGKGEKFQTSDHSTEAIAVDLVKVKTTTTEEIDVVLSRAAVELARAWEQLNGRDRARYKQEIEALALHQGAPASSSSVQRYADARQTGRQESKADTKKRAPAK